MKTNPRISADKAAWLAHEWAAPRSDGRWAILGDAAHKIASASLYRVDEANALYAAIEAPVLSVEADSNSLGQWWKEKYTLAEYHQRLEQVRDVRTARVDNAGHMLHHDQPQEVAGLIESFTTASPALPPMRKSPVIVPATQTDRTHSPWKQNTSTKSATPSKT